ncbi:MAG TPA: tetratricopeptide repeat protein [Bacillota bacterium]|nr:tetratricopeptide repeat protein [Bacillota bacterium]
MNVRASKALPLLVAIVGCLLSPVPGVQAHGELDELINEASREINGNPRDPQLYLKRAELKRLHREWDAALADLDRADSLSNQWHVLHFVRARVLLDAEWFQSAKVAADRFLAREPNHIEALLTRARAKVKLGEREGAADDYSRAIAHTTMPMPELYLERAQALAEDGGQHLDKALEGLDQGITNLGPVVTLQLAAIDLEVKRNRLDAALARLDAAMAQSPNKEIWLARRGDVLRKGGRNQEAAEAYTAALQVFEKLLPARRAVPAMADWEKRTRAALAELAKGGR